MTQINEEIESIIRTLNIEYDEYYRNKTNRIKSELENIKNRQQSHDISRMKHDILSRIMSHEHFDVNEIEKENHDFGENSEIGKNIQNRQTL